jgi:hypothetical protein
MPKHDDPVLHSVRIKDLRPTQMTVGMREVDQKRSRLKEREAKVEKSLESHMIPVVMGPKDRFYVVDHHHFCLALLLNKLEMGFVLPIADFSHLSRESFWINLDAHGWCHPYDAAGARRSFDKIPRELIHLADDPYRSLAGEVRRQGGYGKENVPFSEFLWADFFRGMIKASTLDEDFETMTKEAVVLARGRHARHLPGWCGVE